jgi:hypothetical protein
MRRNRYIALLVALVVVAWGIAAIATGSAGLGLSGGKSTAVKTGGVSPSCLPSTTDHDASLPGTSVDVSPEPETDTANPDTQISFLGVPATEISGVSVVGQNSGSHPGRLEAYSQGDGASFVPASPFDAGERVSVHAVIGAKHVTFGFRVDTPYPTAEVPAYANPPAPASAYESFDTMPGVKAPILDVTVPDHDPAAGDILTTNGPGPGAYGPLIYTPQGKLVWFDQFSGGLTAEDLNVQSYEGQRDLTFWQGKVLSLGFGQGEDVVLNSHYQHVATVKGGNGLKADLHEFQIAPHDISYTTAYNPIRCNLSSAEGEKGGAIVDAAIQEIDMKTGLVRWEWHSLDHVAVAESETSPPKTTPWDWFHLNSIDPEPDGDILISARSTWAAYQLEGASGKILWRLGGTNSSFKMGAGTKTAWQHDGRMLPNGEVTLYDDGANPPIHEQSRALRIALDLKTHEARLSRVFEHPDPPLLAASQGNMQTLADSNTVVEYGGVPEISEYAPNGSLLFDAHLAYELISYRGFRFPWSARPATPPAVVANLNNTAEETIVHASWNGATEVASWRVLAGANPSALQAHATIPATGFESSTILPKKYAYVSVQALDSAGSAIGSSHTVHVGTYASSLPSIGGS